MEKDASLQHTEDARTKDIVSETTIKVQNPKLAAVLETRKPNQWGPGYLRLYAFCSLLFLCSTMNV